MDTLDLQIATYNVHGFPWINVPIKQMVDWITTHCDVVALQEVWCRHPEWAAAFGAAGWQLIKPAREAHYVSAFGSGLAVAWRSSRFALRDSRSYPFLESFGLDVLAVKGWFRVDLVDRRSGTAIKIVNTHLQADVDLISDYFRPRTEAIRKRQARQLATAEGLSAMPTLVIGDFNTDRDIVDGFRFFPSDKKTDDFTGIDRCCYAVGDSWSVSEWRTAVEAEGWSDHLPVVWRLRFSL